MKLHSVSYSKQAIANANAWLFVRHAQVNSVGAMFRTALLYCMEMKKHLVDLEVPACHIPNLGD